MRNQTITCQFMKTRQNEIDTSCLQVLFMAFLLPASRMRGRKAGSDLTCLCSSSLFTHDSIVSAKKTARALAWVLFPKWLAVDDFSRAIEMKGRICKGLKCFSGLVPPLTRCWNWRDDLVPNQTLKGANIQDSQRDRNSSWYAREISN